MLCSAALPLLQVIQVVHRRSAIVSSDRLLLVAEGTVREVSMEEAAPWLAATPAEAVMTGGYLLQ